MQIGHKIDTAIRWLSWGAVGLLLVVEALIMGYLIIKVFL